LEADEAFRRLNLSSSATADEIGQKYRELALAAHPDRGGNSAIFIELQQAYQRALEFSAGQHQLVPLSMVRSLMTPPEDIHAIRQANVLAELGRLRRIQLSHYRNLQRGLQMTGGIVALCIWLDSRYSPVRILSSFDSYVSDVIFFTGLIGLVSIAILYFSLRAHMTAYEDAVADLNDVFTDKQNFYAIMESLLEPDASAPFRSDQLHRRTSQMYEAGGEARRTKSSMLFVLFGTSLRGTFLNDGHADFHQIARILGPEDFARYLIKKGLEIGGLSESKMLVAGIPRLTYSIV
jgi:hypothetical protein